MNKGRCRSCLSSGSIFTVSGGLPGLGKRHL
jgi:hypothetical protein